MNFDADRMKELLAYGVISCHFEWSEAPEWATWAAIDNEGVARFYEHFPHYDNLLLREARPSKVAMAHPKHMVEQLDRITTPEPEEKPMTDINKTLEERGSRYGEFEDFAVISQRLKAVLREELAIRDKVLPPYMMEALEMICHKMARVINGDHMYIDNIHDLEGYAKLVENILNKGANK